jgi:hypothetical protein
MTSFPSRFPLVLAAATLVAFCPRNLQPPPAALRTAERRWFWKTPNGHRIRCDLE